MTAALIAGAISGVAGLLVFLTVHQLWIMPIWFIFPFGAMLASLGGVAAGWAYYELLPALPARPRSTLMMIVLIAAILAPSLILAELRSPLFDVNAEEATLVVSTGHAAVVFIGELLVTSAVMGALLGWLIGRTWMASIATAVAGLVFALGPGHNIPFLGATPATAKGIAILLLVVVVSAVVLVETELRLRGMEPVAGR